MIIDFHTHYFPEKIAENAIASLEKLGGIKAYTDGTRLSLESSMWHAGIDLSLNLPIATSPDQVESINLWAAKNNSPPVLSLGSIHPDTPNPKGVLEKVKNSGLKGIKMHPEFQNFSPNESRLKPIWEACMENNLFIVFHAGGDISFRAPFRSDPAKFAELQNKFPDLKFILAHFGSWKLWDEVEKELIGLPVFLDTSFVFELLPIDKLVSLIKKHGADKVLFGTDSPWRNQLKELKTFNKLSLPETEKELILWKNAAKLLSL